MLSWRRAALDKVGSTIPSWGFVAATASVAGVGGVVAATIATLGSVWAAVAVLAGVVCIVAVVRSLLVGMIALVVGTAIVPPWIALTVAGYRVAPTAGLSMLVILAALAGRRRSLPKLELPDILVVGLSIAAAVSTFLFDSPVYVLGQILFEWVLPYVAMRFLLESIKASQLSYCMAFLGFVVGCIAVMQSYYAFNLAGYIPQLFGPDRTTWATLQIRGGLVRSEVTFGHSIALGGFLAICLAYCGVVRNFATRFVLTAGIVFGSVATLSRSSIFAAGAVLAVRSLAIRNIGLRVVALLSLALGAGGVAYYFDDVTSGAASTEVEGSSGYRSELLSVAGLMRLFGHGVDATQGVAEGTFRWGHFYSIDNGLLYIGLYAGLVVVLLALAVHAVVAFRVLSSRTLIPGVAALVGQIPLVLTVAPITQYQSFYWLMLASFVSSGSQWSLIADSSSKVGSVEGSASKVLGSA